MPDTLTTSSEVTIYTTYSLWVTPMWSEPSTHLVDATTP